MEIKQAITISEAATLIKDKQISPVEMFHYFINRIEKYEPRLNTFITVMQDVAQKQAKQAEKEIISGNYKGPLHGIPISLKDIIAYSNYPMTNGSRVAPDFVPQFHATVTQKLIDAGAVIMGKAHLHEYAYRAPHPYYGWTRNPWDPNRMPGGSSSGSASAVQAALVLGSIGSDSGGSIRIPASYCGVVGLKPTYGCVSCYGITPLSWTLDHVGPLTRTCEDAAILFQAIAGYDPRDKSCNKKSQFDIKSFKKMQSLKGKKFGIPTTYFYDNLDSDVEFTVHQALMLMEQMGAEIIPIKIEAIEELIVAHQIILNSEAYAFHHNNLEDKRDLYGPKLRSALELGQFYSAEAYIQCQRLRTNMKDQFNNIFEKVDVLITPTTQTVAKLIQEYEKEIENKFIFPSLTTPANFLGLPALSVPSGFSSNGLPIGLQIIGRPFSEGEILSIGNCYEEQTLWYKKLPNQEIWVD